MRPPLGLVRERRELPSRVPVQGLAKQVIGQVRIARQERSREVGADARAGQPFAGSPTGVPMGIHPEPCTRPDELSGMWSPESS